MSVALPKTKMNVQQFFDWWERQPDGERFELVDGVVVMMGRDRVTHNRTKTRTFAAFGRAIASASVECEAFIDGLGVSGDTFNFRLPDVVVQCGPVESDASILPNPVIVVEVVSPTSEERDVHQKMFDYFSVASIRHYLIVYADRRYVAHHRRDDDGEIHTSFVREGQIVLDPPGLDLSIGELLGGMG